MNCENFNIHLRQYGIIGAVLQQKHTVIIVIDFTAKDKVKSIVPPAWRVRFLRKLTAYRMGCSVSAAARSHPLAECVTHSRTFQQVGKGASGPCGAFVALGNLGNPPSVMGEGWACAYNCDCENKKPCYHFGQKG